MIVCLTIHIFFKKFNIGLFFNQLTAIISAFILEFYCYESFKVDGLFFGNSDFLIEVRYGCSPIKQMFIAMNFCLCKNEIEVAKWFSDYWLTKLL